MIGLAREHLGPKGTHTTTRLSQGLLGSDVIEFSFCAAKSRNAKRKGDFDRANGKRDTWNAGRAINMKDKGNARGAPIRTQELTAKLIKRQRITQNDRRSASTST